MSKKKIIVVGAGPAGMMAAIRAAELGAAVTLLEKNPTLGRKILLSGKGRCNLTNTCGLDQFLERFSRNGQFLRDAFKKFFHRQLMEFFEKRGLGLRIERQQRVFPVSDRSSSVLNILQNELRRNKVEILISAPIKDIVVRDNAIGGVVTAANKIIDADKVILATGGVSCSVTGSSGEGQKIAARYGHAIVPMRPALVPLLVEQGFVRELEGITLKNIRVKFICAAKEIHTPVGELLFTADGISGPLVLTASGDVGDRLVQNKKVSVEIDLKPGLSLAQLEARILREVNDSPRRSIANMLKTLVPQRLSRALMQISGIKTDKTSAQLTQEERRRIIELLKSFRMDIRSTGSMEQAMVTRGGVSLKEINPRTMESRLIKGLYFAGEMIDVDADTGGFNLQAAFSTGYLAGESAANL